MSKVAVVTDSVANLPPELVERYSITVIPLPVAFGQEVFRDGVDMTSAQFYCRLREDKHLPSTSTPSMGDFLTLFHRLAEEPVHTAVVYADALGKAEWLRQEVASLFNCRELHVTDLTPVMGTHADPGVLGVAWWSEEGVS
jgi:fatty acid-binding protein DegV